MDCARFKPLWRRDTSRPGMKLTCGTDEDEDDSTPPSSPPVAAAIPRRNKFDDEEEDSDVCDPYIVGILQRSDRSI